MKTRMRRGITVMDLLQFVAAVVIVIVCVIKFVPGVFDSHDETNQRDERMDNEADDERLRQARLLREQEEAAREAERLERKKRLAAEEAERQRKIAEQESARRRYRTAQERFAAPFAFAKFAPDDEKPQSVSAAKTFWAVFGSYASDRVIYEVKAEPGGVLHVSSLTSDGQVQDVNAESFLARLKDESYAMTSGGKVWIGGIRMPLDIYPVPSRGNNFSMMENNFGDFLPIAIALGMKAPDVNYRVWLKPADAKTDKDNIPIGSVAYDGVLDRSAIEEAMGSRIAQKARDGISTDKVKLKKFKPTVVFYDGDMVRKEIGVTKVPRSFKHFGTSFYGGKSIKTVEDARRRWQELYNEALRQEQKAQRIQEENAVMLAQAMDEKKRKERDASRKGMDERIIDSALVKSRLIVRRIKSSK